MATAFTVTTVPNTMDYRGIVKYTWVLANGESGDPVTAVNHSDRSVQVSGTFGAGGTVELRGSLDGGTTYAVLTDQNDNNLSITAAKIESVMQITEYFRPVVTAGDGTTALTITLLAKRS